MVLQKFLAALLLLSACSIAPDPTDTIIDARGFEWYVKPIHPPAENIVYVHVDYATFLARCNAWHGDGACADVRLDHGTCYIVSYFVTLDTYLDWHERNHCRGFRHKDRRRN